MQSFIGNFEVAAVIPLFNPTDDCLSCIESVLTQVSKTYVIDNSTEENRIAKSLSSRTEIYYLKLPSNQGVGVVLNLGCKLATQDGYKYLLTMDQDTQLEDGTVTRLLEQFTGEENIGMVTVNHTPQQEYKETSELITFIDFTMTTGNLLSLSAFRVAGSFREDYFIDYIDHEYCLRLRKSGYKIVKINNLFVRHNLGSRKVIRLLGINFFPTFHSPARLYYRTRNRLFVNNDYKRIFPGYYHGDKRRFVREILEILFFEPQKLFKLYMILAGFIDYKKKLSGKQIDI